MITSTCPGGVTPNFLDLILAQEQKIDFIDPVNTGRKNPYSYNLEDLGLADANFKYNFHYKKIDGQLNNPMRDMKIEGFCTFIDDINNAGYDPANNDTHYAALLMHTGMEGNDMQIVFEPVYFIKLNGYYEIQHTEKYYTINRDGSLNALADADTFTKIVAPYQGIDMDSEIFIIRYGRGHDPNYFIDGPSLHADVKFCVITMQQILRMYYDNPGETNPLDDYHVPKGFIRFKFVARQLKHYPDYKLHVLAYRNLEKRGSGLFVNKTYLNLGADFTQMSPPNPPNSVPNLEY